MSLRSVIFIKTLVLSSLLNPGRRSGRLYVPNIYLGGVLENC